MKEYKLLIVSDSHGNMSNIKTAIEKEFPFDILVHCGDIEGSLSGICENYQFDVIAVKGNCDFAPLPKEELFKAWVYNVWVTHGDDYNVKYDMDLQGMKKAAKSRMADIVLFGHSHHAEVIVDKSCGITLINPGSIAYSRTGAEPTTYATLVINDDYEIIPEIKSID